MRLPLVVGSRIAVVNTPPGAVVIAPPPPGDSVSDVGAAVRDALRFPLAGDPAEALVRRGGRATIVLEHPSLPIPGAVADPRREALSAVVDELDRLGIPSDRQTILVAGGLERKTGARELDRLVTPDLARRYRGEVEIHDADDPSLVEIGDIDGLPLRANPALLETDVVVVVSAAESLLHGGPAALLAAGGPGALRRSAAGSLLEAAEAPGWEIASGFERALERHVPLIGVSLALNHPQPRGLARGYPFDAEAVDRVARSALRPLFRALPAAARRSVLHSLPVDLSAAGAYAGPPSVAHAEALRRAVETRSAFLDAPLDVICIAVPSTTPHLPRERPNPLLAASLGLGLALRLWLNAFPVTEGGTAILLHRFHRRFAHSTQQPYREFFRPLRDGPDGELLAASERAARSDERALAAYRSGRSCHPLLPYVDWDACSTVLERLGAVIVAGCRDAPGARQLGFVPAHGLGAALKMARGRADSEPRVGFLLTPPYFPITTVP